MREQYIEKTGDGIIDPQVWSFADAVCAAYFRGDPTISLKQAQDAAVAAVQASRKINANNSAYTGHDTFTLQRLERLGIDSNTLLPKQEGDLQ